MNETPPENAIDFKGTIEGRNVLLNVACVDVDQAMRLFRHIGDFILAEQT